MIFHDSSDWNLACSACRFFFTLSINFSAAKPNGCFRLHARTLFPIDWFQQQTNVSNFPLYRESPENRNFPGFPGSHMKSLPRFLIVKMGLGYSHSLIKCGIHHADKLLWFIILYLGVNVHRCFDVFMSRKVLTVFGSTPAYRASVSKYTLSHCSPGLFLPPIGFRLLRSHHEQGCGKRVAQLALLPHDSNSLQGARTPMRQSLPSGQEPIA